MAIPEYDAKSFAPLASDMLRFLRGARGRLALAAPQVGRSVALVVTKAGDIVLNPSVYLDVDSQLITDTEGCLSLPGKTYLVDRYLRCSVEGYSLDWEPMKFDVHGLEARLWQHEGDHLEGRLISERWPEVARQ